MGGLGQHESRFPASCQEREDRRLHIVGRVASHSPMTINSGHVILAGRTRLSVTPELLGVLHGAFRCAHHRGCALRPPDRWPGGVVPIARHRRPSIWCACFPPHAVSALAPWLLSRVTVRRRRAWPGPSASSARGRSRPGAYCTSSPLSVFWNRVGDRHQRAAPLPADQIELRDMLRLRAEFENALMSFTAWACGARAAGFLRGSFLAGRVDRLTAHVQA